MIDHKLRKILDNSYFIGGSPCSGKSTISEILSTKYDLEYLKIDDYEQEHIENASPEQHPIMYKWSQMSWDEIWMRSVEKQVEEEFEFYRERFSMILNELKKYQSNSKVILESAALLPELLKELDLEKHRVIFLIPSKEFQIKYYSKRGFKDGILKECRQPEVAFNNWMERDHLFGKKVRKQAMDIGYKVIDVNGDRSIKENSRLVEAHFRLRANS
ncbi:hypothetical protein I0Q91_04675 [Halanaerobiaceae bacterium Z-7014]|uniref:Uncharacterized protein n=1 Tax=Halonatronomonas betaini TaxID=2778430 RepID=A0A931AUF2_9FIRM|nr:hypothetical protein [Halonatronomonas betaini]MBF8436366.1 hypothetical protein [Halonatronomonas betaini]